MTYFGHVHQCMNAQIFHNFHQAIVVQLENWSWIVFIGTQFAQSGWLNPCVSRLHIEHSLSVIGLVIVATDGSIRMSVIDECYVRFVFLIFQNFDGLNVTVNTEFLL